MIVKILFLVSYLFIFCFLLFKWIKKGVEIRGNEIIIMWAPILIAFLLRGDIFFTLVRLFVLSLPLFIFYNFWIKILNKKNMIFIYFPSLFLFICFVVIEILNFIVEFSIIEFLLLQSITCYLSVFIFVLIIFERRQRDGNDYGLLSTEVVFDFIIYGFLFLLIGIILIFISFFYIQISLVSIISLVILSGSNVAYLFMNKPFCLNKKDKNQLKQYAYIMGKKYKNGEILEDEGMGIINPSVVEDATILYNIGKLFEKEKVYLNSDVKISDIAARIGTNKVYLSRALTTRLSKNFCQFVNHYRVKEVCTIFINNPQLDIRKLSEECGFNSASNFSIVFKYNTGYTPVDWSRAVRQRMNNNEKVSVTDYIM